jgi:AcrR family transcriptional regulator
MSSANRRRGVTKAQWLEAGLVALGEGGIAAVRVEALARSLGIAKAGFYWHFKDRRDLMQQLLDYWSHEVTEVITDNDEVLSLEPKARLVRTAEMILEYDLTAHEFGVRQWGLQDATAARAVRRVNRTRLDFIRSAFAELGFGGDDLEMRTMLFAVYQTFEGPMLREISRKRRRELIERRVELLASR